MCPYITGSLACLDCDLYGHDGLVLLSIVTQALLFIYLYVQVTIFPFSVMSTRAASGRYRPIRTGFRTRTHRRLE
jgi:hypothetical protein